MSAGVALVTGASRGIGAAIAQELAVAGLHVVVNYLSRADEAEAVVARIREAGGSADAVQADVSDSGQASALVAEVLARHGRLDVLVNNAGITRDGLALRLKDADWQAVLDVDLSGPFYVTRAALKPMIRQKRGRIVNVSSVVGAIGNPGQINYAAAKAGLVGLTKSLAKEVARTGVLVNAVLPGYIESEMTAALSEGAARTALAQIPLDRFGRCEDVARMVRFLAMEGDYVTGHAFYVDGGLAI